MVPKKSSKADLESKRPLFFEIGLALAMLLVLMAFEWKTTRNIDVKLLIDNRESTIIELPSIVKEPETTKQALPKAIPSPDYINIVPDNLAPKGDVDIFINGNTDGPIPVVFTPKEETEVEEALPIVDIMPKFGEGGLEEFRNDFVSKRLKYPDDAILNSTFGCVYVEFVVEKDGSISNVKAVRGPDSILNNEAVRVVKQSPNWTPGRHNGKPARVKFVIPINFVLQR